jgi:hypothetical protein
MVMDYNPFGGIRVQKKFKFEGKKEMSEGDEGMIKENKEGLIKEENKTLFDDLDVKPDLRVNGEMIVNNKIERTKNDMGLFMEERKGEMMSDLKFEERMEIKKKSNNICFTHFGVPCSLPLGNASALSNGQFTVLLRYSQTPPLYPLLNYIINLFHHDPFCTIRLNVFRYLFRVFRLLNIACISYVLQIAKDNKNKNQEQIQQKCLNNLHNSEGDTTITAPTAVVPIQPRYFLLI